MTNLRQLLAINIKQNRCKLGFTQAKLAEKADASTQYIAMLELGRKFPSPEMLERLAIALGIDNLDLFSPPPFPDKSLKKLQKTILADLEKKIAKSVNKAVQETVKTVIDSYMVDNEE
ncbi:MAG: helix-turn-helix transcriptional regulator [Treponema sp.]|jgi:transcriptional regulator with XRE-family HTH domain|nr:helix-turn-helix transcriptional regulator [Treponema sp.]